MAHDDAAENGTYCPRKLQKLKNASGLNRSPAAPSDRPTKKSRISVANFRRRQIPGFIAVLQRIKITTLQGRRNHEHRFGHTEASQYRWSNQPQNTCNKGCSSTIAAVPLLHQIAPLRLHKHGLARSLCIPRRSREIKGTEPACNQIMYSNFPESPRVLGCRSPTHPEKLRHV